MFEKEAENYADRYVTEGVDELKRKVIKGHWQDGAEFGYNKANEKYVEQLTKAKDIIKILLQYDRGQIFPNRIIYEKYMRTRGEAEQFLKEVNE